MCFGDRLAAEKKAAADAQLAEAKRLNDIAEQNQAQTNPFYTNILQNGLPYTKAAMDYTSGDIAKQFNTAKAATNSRLAGYGSTLPSGFQNQTMTDLEAQKARAFDSNMTNLLQTDQSARFAAAQGLNPLAYYGGAQTGNSAVSQAPKVTNGWGDFLSGVVGAAGNAVKFNLGCWVAALVFGEDFDTGPRVNLCRRWLYEDFAPSSFIGRILVTLYSIYGKALAVAIKDSKPAIWFFRRVFNHILRKAENRYGRI